MAIYHFSGQIMSRISKQTGKSKSPLAAAAYRSGEKLVDEIDNKSFFYKREIAPVTHILAPAHAPDWATNRERLWNEVNKVEKNYNAQFAREFNVALPVELSKEEQEKLALEFCQKAFVDRGMVADIAIHRDDESNPHFHVMLTIRPFNEDGSWGVKAKRAYKFDENGNHILDKNGKKAFDKVETTDWHKKDVFNSWRKLWADTANEYLNDNGVNQTITHLSNKDRGFETLPTIHEGYVARQMEKDGKESDRVTINKHINKHNETVIELQNYKAKRERLNYQNKFARKFSPIEKKQLSSIAKELKMFVNANSISERKQQLEQWKKSIQFTKDSEKKLKQLTRIEREETLIHEAEAIFDLESTRFIKEYYPAWDESVLSLSEKVAIVEKTIENKGLLTEDELDQIEEEVYSNELLVEINSIVKNRYAFVLTVDRKIESLKAYRSELEIKLNINPKASELLLKQAALKNPKEFEKLKSVIRLSSELFKARDLINEFYDMEIKKLYPSRNTVLLSLEEKEILIVGTEYYEKPILLESIPTLRRFDIEDQVRLIKLICNPTDENKMIIANQYPSFQLNNPRYLLLFKDECLRSIDELPPDVIEMLSEIDPEGLAEFEIGNSTLIKEMNYQINHEIHNYNPLSALPSGITGGLFTGILEERKFGTKQQFEQDLKAKNKKRNIHRSGPSL